MDQTISRVAVVGGPASIVSTMRRHFARFGIEIVAHLADVVNAKGRSRTVTTIPPDAEGVVCMIDTTSHSVSESAKATAAKSGVPFVGIPRKWSKAEPILRVQGFLPPATNGSTKEPTEEESEDVVLTYICEEREKGRVPKYDEVNSVLCRAFGPNVVLDYDLFEVAHSKAAARVPILTPPKKEKPMTTEDHIYEWAWTLFEDKPERILDLGVFANQILKETKASPKVVAEHLNDAVGAIRKRLASKLPEHQEWKRPIKQGWVIRQFEEFLAGKGPYPTQKILDTGSRAIFGSMLSYAMILDGRAAALGEWARDILPARKAADYFAEVVPGSTRDDLMALVDEGKIKGVNTDTVWFTSKMAIDEYIASLTKAPTPEPVPEPDVVVRVPAPEPEPEKVDHKRPETAPSFDAKKLVEDITLEVGTLLENMIVRKLDEALAPLRERLDAVEKVVGAVSGRTARIESRTAKPVEAPTFEIPEASLERLVTPFAQEVELLTKAVEKVHVELSGDLAFVKKHTEGLHEAITSLSRDKEMTLRALGELAKDTGLKVTITTGG